LYKLLKRRSWNCGPPPAAASALDYFALDQKLRERCAAFPSLGVVMSLALVRGSLLRRGIGIVKIRRKGQSQHQQGDHPVDVGIGRNIS
jgi:hypothetical protein